MSDAESHGPTLVPSLEAREAARDADWEGKCADEIIEAAYPFIRKEVCQELATAIREENARSNGMFDPDDHVAEFVERFGKATTDGE